MSTRTQKLHYAIEFIMDYHISSMTNTSVVVWAINWVISLYRHLLSSAFILTTSTFIVRTSWCSGSNH